MRRAIVLVGLLLSCGPRHYFTDPPAAIAAKIDSYAARIMESRPIPGLAIGVVSGRRLIYAKGFGSRSLSSPEPITPQTVFHTASVSKSVVASAIWQLAEQGKLRLDDRVVQHLPDFRMAASEVTVRQLLSHTSGMPDVDDYQWERPEHDDDALQRCVQTLRSQKLTSSPGAAWHYSNAAYDVLGALIAARSGNSFEEYVQKTIFSPLAMTSTTFLAYEGQPARLAAPHRGSHIPTESKVYPYNRAHAPSSTMKSTVEDLAKFVAANLSTDRYESLWKAEAPVDDGVKSGLGWFLRRHRGTRVVLNAGRDPGFNCAIAMLPDRDVGVIVLSNYDGQSSMEMVEIAEGLLTIGAGDDPAIPKASINVPLARIAARDGAASALAAYPSLSRDARYEVGVSDLITLGHEFYKREQYADAARFYQLNIDAHPKYFYGYVALAKATLKLGNPARAADLYRAGIARHPEDFGCPKSCYAEPELEKLIATQTR